MILLKSSLLLQRSGFFHNFNVREPVGPKHILALLV